VAVYSKPLSSLNVLSATSDRLTAEHGGIVVREMASESKLIVKSEANCFKV